MKKRIAVLTLCVLMLCCYSSQVLAGDTALCSESIPVEYKDMVELTDSSESAAQPDGWNGATEADHKKEDATPVQGFDVPSEDAIVPYASKSGEWVKSSDGRWWYRYSDGTYPANCWAYIDNKWYHFDASGWMQTGWLEDGGKRYYLSSSGAMVTGWYSVSGTWYFFNSSGAMISNGQTSSLSAVYDNIVTLGINDYGFRAFDVYVKYTEHFTQYSGKHTFTSRDVYYTVSTADHGLPVVFYTPKVSHSTNGTGGTSYPLTRTISTIYPGDLWKYGNSANDQTVSYSATTSYSGRAGFGLDGASAVDEVPIPWSKSISIPFGSNS